MIFLKLMDVLDVQQRQRISRAFAILLIAIACTFGLGNGARAAPLPSSILFASLAQGNAITDPKAILRYALPIDNPAIRKAQSSLEDIANQLRGKRWGVIIKDLKSATYQLIVRGDRILESIPDDRQAEAKKLLASLNDDLADIKIAVDGQDKERVAIAREVALDRINQLEELMVTDFPFATPPEYANLPQLLGRATVEMKTTQGDLTLVLDGYSAPINAGNFVDLVKRGFYDGLPFIRSEDFYVLQAGDPAGPDEGFIDPKTGEYRAIPLEILVKGEKEPLYGFTLEDVGIYLADLALPFNAYGAIALARPSTDPNGGSSQFFFFKFDSELTPPGFNLLDGRYSVFGYVVDGKDTLDKLTDKDEIISARVIQGLDNLVEPPT